MAKERDISKTLALVLIILTVLISATSTWFLINSSMSSVQETSLNKALVHLHILKGPVEEMVLTDTNSGDVKLFIAGSKGG